jgi:hypothetical protein
MVKVTRIRENQGKHGIEHELVFSRGRRQFLTIGFKKTRRKFGVQSDDEGRGADIWFGPFVISTWK